MAAKADVEWSPRAIIIMGVSGSGKSTLAAALAKAWSIDFVEGDDLHDAAARAKMAAGEALCDEDRWPWLDRIAVRISSASADSDGRVIATCSSLKRSYRDRLRAGIGIPVGFVYLELPRAEIERRLEARIGHYMPASLLDSQLAALQPPRGELDVLDLSPDDNPITAIEAWLRRTR